MQHTPTKVVTSQRFSFSEDRLAYKVASDDDVKSSNKKSKGD